MAVSVPKKMDGTEMAKPYLKSIGYVGNVATLPFLAIRFGPAQDKVFLRNLLVWTYGLLAKTPLLVGANSTLGLASASNC
jgi:hypothetical protein